MQRLVPLLVLALLPGSVAPARAHGLWAHVHVTGWAIEVLPPGELADFFADPEVRNAAMFGAAFTDSGYWPQGDDDFARAARAYGEHTHWEPFVEDYVAWMLAHDPPPWTSLESKRRVAFLMGCAAHGLQDELFDSLFLYQVEARDGVGQDATDPASDALLVIDGHIHFVPTKWVPMDVLLDLYAHLEPEITAETIDRAVGLVTFFYINDGDGVSVARGAGEPYLDQLPWMRAHYMDPAVPGSLASEVAPTAAYYQALWDRLHGRGAPPALATYAYPAAPHRLLGPGANSVDSWVTLVFGTGARVGTANAELTDDAGASVAFSRADTRWTGNGATRILRLRPEIDLVPGGWYDVRLLPGAELVDGETAVGGFEHHFQVACASPEDPACPEPDPEPAPEPEPEPVPEASEPEPAIEQTVEAAPEAEPETPTSEDEGCAGAPFAPIGATLALAIVRLRWRATTG